MKNNIMLDKVPSVKEAELLLEEARKLNPGPWIEHSMFVGKAARFIAENCPNLNPDTAYAVGLLHDIGRRYGVTSMRHSIDGYSFLIEKGYDLAAKICLTHSFPYKNINEAFGKWDCSDEEYKFVDNFIESTEFGDYDKLIQLCDALALPEGFVLIEKRIIDVALRHGVNEHTVQKWKSTFEIQKHFENIMGRSIYSVLPGVVGNTFNI